MATRPRPARHLLLILAVIVLLPALFYSAYEISMLSQNEQMMAAMYGRQLDFILFSLNQHAWDIVNTWAGSLAGVFEERPGTGNFDAALQRFLRRNPAIDAVFSADTLGGDLALFGRQEDQGLRLRTEQALQENDEVIERVNRYKRLEYRRMEPVALGDTAATYDRLMLIFAMEGERRAARLGGMILNGHSFVQTVLGPRLTGASGEEFAAAVLSTRRDSIVFSTSDVQSSNLRHRRDLWVLPGYSLGIATRGATVEELVGSRFTVNLGLILLLDVILIAGAWLVYRSVRKEMELVRLKSDFISNVSHELRTPLALIRMFGETLEMGRVRSEEKKHEYYATIVAESERLTRLVNNILNFSRMEAGRKEYHFAGIDLNGVVSDVLKTYGFHLQSEGFTPVISLEKDLPSIRGDAESIAEAVINLVDNAMKYSPGEKFLRVSTGQEDGRLFVEIEDHGVGIAREYQEKIFETFYRVSSGLVHTARGSGLGLTLVKHIMDAHGGAVRVESVPGKGSRFRLLFPIHHSAGDNHGEDSGR